jgi:hypothetical protein
MSKEVTQKLPVAVTVKPVLSMVRAHIEDRPLEFKKYAIEVARELELNGEQELADYIYAQYHMIRTFEVTD